MRNRKGTLLAASKEEYCQMYDEQEEQFIKRKRRYHLPKKLNQSNSDDSDDQLGASSEYHLTRKKRTMAEDEEELTTKLEKINLDIQTLKNKILPNDLISEINISPTTKSTGSNHSDDSNPNFKEFFLNQNIINYDDLLKIVIIGETGAGKSLFISKLNQSKSSTCNTNEYCPTKTFEITKTVIDVNGRSLGLELWDTNILIVSSELIKTYYKLSNGFVIVINYANMVDCSFILKQIELILSCKSSPNIFLMVNENNKNRDYSDSQKTTLNEKVEALVEKYLITKMICDLSMLNIHHKDKAFISFLQNILTRRDKEKRNQNNNKCNYNNNNLPKRVRTTDYSMENCKNEVPINTPSHIIKSKLNKLYDELNLGG